MVKRILAAVAAMAVLFTAVPQTGVVAEAAKKTAAADAVSGSAIAASGSSIATSGSAIAASGSSISTTGSSITYAKIKLKKKSYTLHPGDTVRLKIKWGKGKKTKLTYSVKNKSIAKVSKKGVVTAVKAGKTTVIVKTKKGSSAKAKITVRQPKVSKKTVYLTFDDGPGSRVTPQLLKVLKKNNVKATFFIVGTQAKGNEKLLRQIVKDGHTIAIHTYTHDYRKIYSSSKAYLDDFHKTEKLIKKATGVQPRYFRFPGGGNNHYMSTSLRNEVLRQLHKEGYTEMDWNCGTSDAAGTYYSQAQLIRYGETSHWGSDPIVLLQHDANSKYHTPAVTDALIKYYRSKGYQFSGLDNYTGPEMCFRKR